MAENVVSINGVVGTQPQVRVTRNGHRVADFRLAQTPRFRDAASGEWTDGRTTWITVICWQSLAANVGRSLRTGDRIIVQGRLEYEQWEREGQRRSQIRVVASAVGHDLTHGVTEFHKIRWSADPLDRADELDEPIMVEEELPDGDPPAQDLPDEELSDELRSLAVTH